MKNSERKILTMCSSVNRPELLKRMIDSYEKTTHSDLARLVVYVSSGDKFVEEYKKIKPTKRSSIEFGPKKTMVQVLNYFSCEKYREYDYYSEVNDDHVFITIGWDAKMANAIDSKNRGVSIAYGRTQLFPTATMHGAKLVHGLGYFFPPIYIHTFVDLWLMELGFKSGCTVYVPDVLIDHRHPVFKKGDWDGVYREGGDETHYAKKLHDNWVKNCSKKDILFLTELINKELVITEGQLEKISEPMSCLVTTYDRLDILERTVRSYLSVDYRPSKLYVFDDGSKKFNDVVQIVSAIPEAVIIKNSKNYGSDGNIIHAQRTLFELGAKVVVCLDSDCLFSKNWWKEAGRIANDINLDKNLVCLFDARVHETYSSVYKNLVRKKYVGGLGIIISKMAWSKHVTEIEKEDLGGWDGKLCTRMRNVGGDIFASSPSMLQHIGGKSGVHCNVDKTECIADNFDGENDFDTNNVSQPRNGDCTVWI